MTMGQSAEPAEEIAEGHGAEISSDPDWKTRRTQFTPSPQYQQGPTSTHTKNSNRPQGDHKNSDHILDQNAARKTGGPTVGPPVLRAQSVPRKWALVFGPCQ